VQMPNDKAEAQPRDSLCEQLRSEATARRLRQQTLSRQNEFQQPA
jgi:hypothetical protein